MKTLPIFLVLLAVNVESAERGVRRAPPRSVEIIIPTSTNLFLRQGNAVIVGAPTRPLVIDNSTNRLVLTNDFAAGFTNRNTISFTNEPAPRTSILIGPVFPGPATNLTPTGRDSGFDRPDPLLTAPVTNALGQVITNAPGTELPRSTPPPTPTPLTPPTTPNVPPPSGAPLSPTPPPPSAPPGGQPPAPPPPPPPPAPPGAAGAR